MMRKLSIWVELIRSKKTLQNKTNYVDGNTSTFFDLIPVAASFNVLSVVADLVYKKIFFKHPTNYILILQKGELRVPDLADQWLQ